MTGLPSNPFVLTSAIAQDGDKTDTLGDKLVKGIPEEFSREIILEWDENMRYSVGAKVIHFTDPARPETGAVYELKKEIPDGGRITPGEEGSEAYWARLGTVSECSQHYLLRKDLNGLFYRLSDFWRAMQCGGFDAVSFSKTLGAVSSGAGGTRVGGFPEGALRVHFNGGWDEGDATVGLHDFYVIASRHGDNAVQPDNKGLLAEFLDPKPAEDPHWKRLLPSLKYKDFYAKLVLLGDRQEPPEDEDGNVYCERGAFGYGSLYYKKGKKVGKVFVSDAEISEIWIRPDGSAPKSQVYGWRNKDNQMIVNSTSCRTTVQLLTGYYEVICIGAGGGPYSSFHFPCAHCYSNPGDGGAGFAGVMFLESGTYTVVCSGRETAIRKGSRTVVSAQAGGLAYLITKHTSNPEPYGEAPSVTYDRSCAVGAVTARAGNRGFANYTVSPVCPSYKGQTISGTGGASPIDETVYGIDCRQYGYGSGGEGCPACPNHGKDAKILPAGKGLVFIRYAGCRGVGPVEVASASGQA